MTDSIAMLGGVSGEETKASLQAQTQAFLSEFFSKGQQLVRELVEENERLRSSAGTPRGSSENTTDLVLRLLRQIEQLEREFQDVRRLAGSVRQESGGYRERLDVLEREHYNLAAMYVAANQFHSATTVEDVVRTITEILLNFVGVGRFTLYCLDETRNVLFPVSREGGDLEVCEELELDDTDAKPNHPLAAGLSQLLANLGPWKSGDALGAGEGTLVRLPLYSGDRLVGIVRVEEFLPQKQGFSDNDFGLLELISEQAGTAIENAWIRSHARDIPLAREALEGLVRR